MSVRLSPVRGRVIVRQRLARLSGRARLSETDAARLSCRLTARHYAAGEVILIEGVHGDCLGLVRSGRVAVYSSLSDRDRPTGILLPGSTFGEAMLIDGLPSSSTFRAITAAEVLFLRRADFLAAAGQRRSRPADTIGRWLPWLAAMTLASLVIGLLLTLAPTRQAMALVPYSVGLWLEQHGHADRAETAWTLSQHLTPDWAIPHLSLGNLYLRRRQLDQAKTELEQALVSMPDLAEAHNSLGLLYAEQGDHAAAIESFQRAATLEPGQAAVEENLAFTLQLTGQRDEALRHYALARSLNPPRPLVLTNEAIAHYEVGDLNAAEAAAHQALALDSRSAPAHTVLGAVNLAQERPYTATLSLERAIDLNPTYGPAHFYLGLAYESLNRPSLAYAAFEHVVSLNHDPLARQEAYRHLSDLHIRYGATLNRDQPYPSGERK